MNKFPKSPSEDSLPYELLPILNKGEKVHLSFGLTNHQDVDSFLNTFGIGEWFRKKFEGSKIELKPANQYLKNTHPEGTIKDGLFVLVTTPLSVTETVDDLNQSYIETAFFEDKISE